ncbi:replicative DNA helicase [Nonlabens sp. SCSIO 43208]|uniref:replicative DNA helicase n=1 Tax=Nonlabens sp. SCSIO 43208 TaxID=2793009 RepID=UPI003D6B7998
MKQPKNTYKQNQSSLRKISGEGMVPPQAVDIEVMILGSLLTTADAIHEVANVIKEPKVFYKPAHVMVYKAVLSLVDKMAPVDMITVGQELRKLGYFEKVGGDRFLVELVSQSISTAHIEHHCRILLQKYIARQTILLSNEIASKAYDDTTDVIDLLADVSNQYSNLQDLTLSGSKQPSFTDVLKKVEQRVEIISSKDSDALTGVTCGLSKLDKWTSGWQPGELIIPAARPSMGKTAFMIGGMNAAAKQDLACGFISLETTTVKLVTRQVAQDSHFHLTQLLTKGFDKLEDFEKLRKVTQAMSGYKCYYNDQAYDISDIIAVARKWVRDHQIKILYIDYLQLIKDRSYKGDNRERQVSGISRKLKLLAKELNIPVVAPSQLSRKCEDRPSKRPVLSDLRESGSIEQDADIVFFIFRPEVYGIDPKDDEDMVRENCNMEFIIAKFKDGPVGSVLGYFKADKTKFYNHDYIPYENYVAQGSPSDAFGDKDDLAF